ncbi:MAG: tetratricopeptide repeat protein, partial [Aeromicrobium sp.]
MVQQSAVIIPVTEATRAARPLEQAKVPLSRDRPIARSDVAPIIRSKIQAPALRASTLSRQRLLDMLGEATANRVTLLVAEAGYGKTTLLADFAQHSRLRTFWYRLDPTDADPITWTNYLIAAGREHDPGFGKATSALLAQISTASPPNNVIVASLIDELNELGDVPSALVLDDFHAVDESADARDFVERLVRDGPAWLHLVLATRRRPSLQLGRLEAMGELAQITTDDLRFSLPETEKLFADSYGRPLEPDVLRNVEGRTQGWAASLQLFYGSIRGKSSSAVRTLARSLSGASRPLYDFLAEEVLGNVPDSIDQFMVRASVLDLVSVGYVIALFADMDPPPTIEAAREWMEEADRLGLLSRTSQTSEARLIHPLLRDFLGRRLAQRMDERRIGHLHLRVAKAVESTDPLVASKHYLEAGHDSDAMRCLGSSVMLTMGSGQWGVASGLIDRLRGVPADPAVAAIQARRLIEEGDLDRAGILLDGVDITDSPPDVRAVFRHAKLSLGWRTGDRELMFATLREIQEDAETPRILAQIFQIFVDASPLAHVPVPYATLAHRMKQMSEEQGQSGHNYYAAISLHNAALTLVAAGRFKEAVTVANQALDVFDRFPGVDHERYSTHAVLALCAYELGDAQEAEERIRTALSSGKERGDVHAECAYALLAVGEHSRASQLLLTAADLQREGRSDVAGDLIAAFSKALMVMPSDPNVAISLLSDIRGA